MKHGLLLIDKPPSCTSHDVVRVVRRAVGQKKVGHCGTLDPDATGLLVLTLGWSTRLTRFLIRAPKIYAGAIRFGTATDTYDASGEVIEEGPTDDLDHERIEAAMKSFEGLYSQTPPPYCAKKVGGVKYYELARRGEEVPESKKEITIFELSTTGPLEEDRISFRLACSSGTYVRTLAFDLGNELDCGAHLVALERLQVGPFKLDAAIDLESVEEQPATPEALGTGWIPFDEIPLPFGEVTADSQQERRIVHGQTVLVRPLDGGAGDWIKLVNRRSQLIAVGSVAERIGDRVGVIQPRIVFKK